MITKNILKPHRVRRIEGGFSFIPHRFLTDGFLTSLGQKELLLYLFLILVSDRHGLSFYRYDSICSLLQFTLDQYIEARNSIIEKDLIAFDGVCFQVLSLPEKPVAQPSGLLKSPGGMEQYDPATVRNLITRSLEESLDD